jgi:uncharacterized protein YndB with AHSA1/START domain
VALAYALKAGLVALLALAGGAAVPEASEPFTDEERRQLAQGDVIVLAEVDAARTRGEARAAVRIAAPRERIFRTLTNCEAALGFVPHLKRCRVLERAPDDSWLLVEHVVDYGWYLPRIVYVFRAEHEAFDRIRFRNERGDLEVHEGTWELTPANEDGGRSTIVTYRVDVVPRFFVPRRLVLSSLKRDLPALMRGLRALCEEAG